MLSLIDGLFLGPSSILASLRVAEKCFASERVRALVEGGRWVFGRCGWACWRWGLEPKRSWMPMEEISICFSQMEGVICTSMLFSNSPLTTSPPTRQIWPLPFCTPAFHSPLQNEPSVQNISPYPSRLSDTKLPLQKLPEGKYSSPQPYLRPSAQLPEYLVSPLAHLPLPWRSPLRKLPSQDAPLRHTQLPNPSKRLFWQSPRQTSPLEKRSSPLPCFSPLTSVPSNRVPPFRKTPFPCIMPSFHCPRQAAQRSTQSPLSWRSPFRKQPRYAHFRQATSMPE